MKPKLGRKMKVGQCFETPTKKMSKEIRHFNDRKPTLIHKKPGTKAFFQHKGRRYFCEVIGTVETRTGWYNGIWLYPTRPASLDKRVRWWQFVYVVPDIGKLIYICKKTAT